MISVSIAVNGVVLMARSAVSTGEESRDGKTRYQLDDGSSIWHDRERGAVPLAIEMLKTIKEQRKD